MNFIKSIRLKYFLCLMAVSILPILIFFLYTYKNNEKFYNEQIETASSNEVRRITTRINENYQDIQDLLSSLLFSTYDGENCITSISEQEGKDKSITDSQRLKNYRMFKYICTNLLESSSTAEGVYLFCENGHVYTYMKNLDYGIEKYYQEDSWYENLLADTDSVQSADLVTLRKTVYGQGDTCFLAAQKFWTVKGNTQAVLAVVCNDTFFDHIGKEESLPWGNSLIIDTNGNCIYGNRESEIFSAALASKILEIPEGTTYLNDDSAKGFIFGTLDINNWKVVSSISFELFYENYLNNSRVMYLLMGLDFLLIIVIVFWMERHSIRPIVRLAKIMETTTQRGFIFHNEYNGRKDEIGVLYAYYEKMIEQINRLIKEKYESEIKTLKSRLCNLTSQINSHFIFNTLENISCLAQIEGNKQIVTMSKSLGDMLRYSMDFEGDLIRIDKEIGHICQYLNIQEVRFGNKIFLNLKFEDDCKKRKVMKFMLQPIVENAIEHGMVGKDFPWKIEISGRREENTLIIKVKDNGIGMDCETLKNVRRRIYEPQKIEQELRSHNIGLANIHERLQIIFSKEYGLEIDSFPNKGTVVKLRIPWT